MGVNIGGLPSKESPFPPTYYPSVTNQVDATIIELKKGQNLHGVDITLPSRLTSRVIEGRVMWSDMTPVNDWRVSIRIAENRGKLDGSFISLPLKNGGRFTYEILEGLQYEIQPNGSVDGKYVYAEPIIYEYSPSNQVIQISIPLSLKGKN